MTIDVVPVPDGHRYEARIDGAVAGHVDYTLAGKVITFVHTEVSPDFEGRGVGGALARGVLDDARRQGLEVIPVCPFIAGWLEKHPDFADLVHQA